MTPIKPTEARVGSCVIVEMLVICVIWARNRRSGYKSYILLLDHGVHLIPLPQDYRFSMNIANLFNQNWIRRFWYTKATRFGMRRYVGCRKWCWISTWKGGPAGAGQGHVVRVHCHAKKISFSLQRVLPSKSFFNKIEWECRIIFT